MSDLSDTSPIAEQRPNARSTGKAAVILLTDKNYFLPTFAAALSADANTLMGTPIYLFVVDAEEAWLQQFGVAVSGTKISIRAARFPQLAELSLLHRDVVPPIALARLWIGSLLGEDVERFLYIDGDTMVDDELESLLAISPPESGLMAVSDFMRIYVDELSFSKRRDIVYLRSLGCSASFYFNSGVIYTSKSAWNSIAASAICFLREHPDCCIASDQSALNHAARGNVNLLPLRYNYQSEYMMALDPRERGIKPTIWHFVGAPKPWDAPGWPWDNYFNRFYRQAEVLLENCHVTLPVPPKEQVVAGLAHRQRNRFRMKWVYPWRRFTRRQKILSLLLQ
ncbi:glycosyltransferase family 8 protein [Mesorhizobium sp. BR1-1-3]|uniref:glycosyltransferase family 8 protein n=1 Tax=Mesorhizobium sp. BR1-1-3 TaxID=2876651 RepID=UPI001CD150E1|nr:glycosyltransferase [Mesorhizobium sp. BR1-1-3]MBZ9892225.1 glycosyltransferase family 8 protein [Mesorhizobium sp. BR1-1-3]